MSFVRYMHVNIPILHSSQNTLLFQRQRSGKALQHRCTGGAPAHKVCNSFLYGWNPIFRLERCYAKKQHMPEVFQCPVSVNHVRREVSGRAFVVGS